MRILILSLFTGLSAISASIFVHKATQVSIQENFVIAGVLIGMAIIFAIATGITLALKIEREK